MRKKAIVALLIAVILLCVCFVGCDTTPTNQDDQVDVGNNDNQNNQTDTEEKDIRNLANKNKIDYDFVESIGYTESPGSFLLFNIELDVDFTKLSNYQEVLAELGLSEKYENDFEKIRAGYYTKLNEYYAEYIKEYFPNGENIVASSLENPTADISWLEKEQRTMFCYHGLELANKDYDSLFSLTEREEINKIHISGTLGFTLLPDYIY